VFNLPAKVPGTSKRVCFETNWFEDFWEFYTLALTFVYLFLCVQLVSIWESAFHPFTVLSLWLVSFMLFPFSVRSPQWLRSKWWALKKHVPESDATTFQGVSPPPSPYKPSTGMNWVLLMALSQCSGTLLMWPPMDHNIWLIREIWEVWWPHGLCSCFQIKQSGLEPWLGKSYFVLEQEADVLNSHRSGSATGCRSTPCLFMLRNLG